MARIWASALDSNTIRLLYKKLDQSIPEARSELLYENHFELLVAVILSAQATDKIVNEVTPPLFESYSTPHAILACGEEKLARLIQRIGLAPTKAKNIIRTCQILIDKHGGEVPKSREALEQLPGVGRKTASVVLNEAFGQATIAVDTHVFRVANRTGLAPGKSVLETEMKLLEVTPKRWVKTAHHLLILHGRYTCKAKNFSCAACVIHKECGFQDKTG